MGNRWLAASLTLVLAAGAQAQSVHSIFTTVQSSDASLIPGVPGARFTGLGSFHFSQNGQRWAFRGTIPGTSQFAILTGQGTSRSGSSLVAQTGVSTGFDGGNWAALDD